METLFQTLFLLALALHSFLGFSQPCIPNAPTGNPGVFPPPDSIPCIERNEPYDFTMQIENYDTIVMSGITFLMDTAWIDSITHLPCGITWQANKLKYAAGETGCIRVGGTTQKPVGQYPLRIYMSLQITIPTFGTQFFSGELNDLLAQFEAMASGSGAPPLGFDYKYVSRVINQGDACPARDTTCNNITGRSVICAGDTTNFTTSGGTSYSWSGPNGFTATTVSTGSISMAGIYSVTVTDTDPCNNYICSKRLLVADTTISGNIFGNNVICANEFAYFSTSSAGASYSWSGPNGFTGASSQTGAINTPGVYSVTINPGTACPVSGSRTLTVKPLPTISVSGDNTICSGETTQFSASGGVSYQWSGPNGFFSSSSATGTISAAGAYSVTGTGSNGCRGTSSYQLIVASVPEPEICIVGVDSATGKNIIVWEKPVTSVIDSYHIYRETNQANVYAIIGSQAYGDFSAFIDQQSVPEQISNRYKLGIIDSCGLTTTSTNYHKTIHLNINQGVGNTWNLSWNHYEGFAFGSYNIYRGTTSANLALLNSIASNVDSYTDLNPPATSVVYYQIEVINPGSCNPSAKMGSYSSSRSNIVSTPFTGMNEPAQSRLKMYPNPFTSIITIEMPEPSDAPFELKVLDVAGSVLLNQQGISVRTFTLNRNTLPQGVFYVELKGAKNIYRGKIIGF